MSAFEETGDIEENIYLDIPTVSKYKIKTEQSTIQINETIQNTINDISSYSHITLESILKQKITDYQNKICICFDIDNKALFLGDIDKNIYEDFILNNSDGLHLKDEYKTIKVAHHGTKNYFVKDLPYSQSLIISNGESIASKPITALYGSYYCDRKLICTNYERACEFTLADTKCELLCPRIYKSNICGIDTMETLKI